MTEPCGITGGCLCGAVRFEVRAQPHRVGLCHCLDCRKQHGAPFGALAIFPAGQVTFTGDEPGPRKWSQSMSFRSQITSNVLVSMQAVPAAPKWT